MSPCSRPGWAAPVHLPVHPFSRPTWLADMPVVRAASCARQPPEDGTVPRAALEFLKETPPRPVSTPGNEQTPRSFPLKGEEGQRVSLVSLEQQWL